MKYIYPVLICLLFFSCSSRKKIDARWARDRNVATKLMGKTVVYTVFIDSKSTLPWSGFDIKSTKDSLEKVFSWIAHEGKKYNQEFEILPVYAEPKGKKSFKKKLPYSSLSKAFSDGDYTKGSKLEKWASGIVKKLDKGIKLPNNESLPKKPKLDAFHKLVEKVKKNYNADNVVINFMLNNYYIVDVSAVLNNMTDKDCEFAINSGKNVNLLAAQFLSLFGAQNLSSGSYGTYEVKAIGLAKQDFPNDVMVDFDSDIVNLNIGSYTAYLIGWVDNVNSKYENLFMVEPVKKKKNERFK